MVRRWPTPGWAGGLRPLAADARPSAAVTTPELPGIDMWSQRSTPPSVRWFTPTATGPTVSAIPCRPLCEPTCPEPKPLRV